MPFRLGPWEVALLFSMLFGLAVYLLPTIIAAAKRKTNTLRIVLLNVFAGWSVIGWIIALVWALSANQKSTS